MGFWQLMALFSKWQMTALLLMWQMTSLLLMCFVICVCWYVCWLLPIHQLTNLTIYKQHTHNILTTYYHTTITQLSPHSGIPLKADTVLCVRPHILDELGEPQVVTIGGPFSGLNKWEGGVMGADGAMYCMPLNHKQVPVTVVTDCSYVCLYNFSMHGNTWIMIMMIGFNCMYVKLLYNTFIHIYIYI